MEMAWNFIIAEVYEPWVYDNGLAVGEDVYR